jgi:hypothetical protein
MTQTKERKADGRTVGQVADLYQADLQERGGCLC